MPMTHRPDSPPTELVQRGKARLLEQLSAIAMDSNDPTMPSDRPDSSGAITTWDRHVQDQDRYVFGEVFAAGGLGVVRRGQDRRLGRAIAIKELLRDSPQAARRFALEAAITARLQHPGIVPLYDLGWQGEGKPYYCMQLVDGDSLEGKIGEANSLTARLRLVEHVIAVADAIAYAHERQIIHRDIKPANVLVGRFGETVVIDWGLAKDISGTILSTLDDEFTQASDAGVSDMTEAGTVMGTLRYMSPEQAQGEAVDARSDVYSLGALLYHVLAGKPPFDRGEREELIHRVLAGQLQPLVDIDPAIPGELAAIAEQAMAVRPEHRYASAAAFAEDLRRFQAGRMVSAHAYSIGETLGRWVRRHRVVVGASMVTLAAITGVGLAAASRIGAERALADEAETAATAEAERADRLAFERSVAAEAKLAVEVLTLAQTPGRELEALVRGVEVVVAHGPELEQAPDPVFAGLSRALAGVIPVVTLDRPRDSALGITDPSADGSRLAAITWKSPTQPELQLWSLDGGQKLSGISLTEPDFVPRSLALSPDNRLFAVGDARRCMVFDVESGERTLDLDDCADPTFATDGRSLFTKVPREELGGSQLYGAIAAWDLATHSQRWATPMAGENFILLAHPDGERLIVRGDHHTQETVEILAAATGERQASLARPPARPRRYGGRSHAFARPDDVALSPDGRTLVVAETDEDGRIVLWNLESGTPTVLDLDGGYSSMPTFSADGRWLLVGGHPIRAYDLEQHELVSSLAMSGFVIGAGSSGLAIADNRWLELPRGSSRQAAPTGRFRSVRATPDGRFLITATDADTRVWSSEDHLALERWTPPPGETIEEFGVDQILTSDRAGVLRIHARDARSRGPVVVDAELAAAKVLARAPGRPSIVALESAGAVEIRDLVTGELRCTIPREPSTVWRESAFGDDGEAFVSTDEQGRGHIWELEHCRERTVARLYDPASDVDGKYLSPLRLAEDGTLVVRHLGHAILLDRHGREVRYEDECAARSAWGYSVLSPDGRVLVSSCDSSQVSRGRARLWDVERDEVIAEVDLRSYTTRPWFSSDGELLIFGAGNRELAVVQVADGRELLRVPIQEVPGSFPKLRVRQGQPIVDVLTVAGDLVSYPITRAQLVDAACRILARSELAAEAAASCSTR